MTNFLNNSFNKLFDYVTKNNYEGHDLFDGLNSRLFKNSFFYKSSFFRLALIQFCKLSPINFRPLLFVPKDFNPKGGALFLLGNLNKFKSTGEEKYKIEAQKLYGNLKSLAIRREIGQTGGIGWGYNFDWQARAFYVPIGVPNVVTSVYVGFALIEYYKIFEDNEALEMAKQVSEFILNEMVLFEDENNLCFRYIPEKDAEVHNANLLAASFLSSMCNLIDALAPSPLAGEGDFQNEQNPASSRKSGEGYMSNEIKNKIRKSVNFSISDIDENGTWAYGTKPFHRWVDNFHTAFNIESLINIRNNLDWPELNETIEKVTDYYFENLFTKEGLPKYYNNKLYPIDIHVIAETMVVLNKIKTAQIKYDQNKFNCIETSLTKLVEEFQDKKGYFYFQENKCFGKYYWNKIPYIRWAQAWMFYALSIYSD